MNAQDAQNTLVTDVGLVPGVDHDEAMVLAQHEYERFLDLLRTLHGDDWARPTDCDEWDVRAVALHVLGASAANASMREMLHQVRAGKKLFAKTGGHHWVDGTNEVQVQERAHLSNDDIVREFEAIIPKAMKGRRQMPRTLRKMPFVKLPPPYTKRLTLGWLIDRCYTRDVWMHRVDIARAANRDIVLTPEHDGRLVADIVAEWATTHADRFDLELTGPAGGRFRRGTAAEFVSIDAVEFVRVLSGRAPGEGVLANSLPL